MNKKLAIITSIFAFVFLFVGVAVASSHLLPAFTQAELNTNWEADRYYPTGGVNSVSDHGRDDVAKLGVDSTMTQTGTFQRTEGIKTVGSDDFGTSVQVDLYVDSDWENKAIRAGFWVVGDNGAGARDNLFGILEFVNLEPSTSGISAQGNHEGWRYWNSVNGWNDLRTDFTYGEWVTLRIDLDTENKEYNFYINDSLVANGPGGQNFIRELFLNSYNYGEDVFPTLSTNSYSAHWHAGIEPVGLPTNKDECKKGGWMTFDNPTFKNQGECVSYVQSNEKAGKRN